MRKAVFALLAIMPLASMAAGNFVVKDMRVEGLQRISEGTVFNYLPINIGDTIDSVRIGEAIRSLYGQSLFDDIEMRRDEDTLIIIVRERPSIENFMIDGNKDTTCSSAGRASETKEPISAGMAVSRWESTSIANRAPRDNSSRGSNCSICNLNRRLIRILVLPGARPCSNDEGNDEFEDSINTDASTDACCMSAAFHVPTRQRRQTHDRVFGATVIHTEDYVDCGFFRLLRLAREEWRRITRCSISMRSKGAQSLIAINRGIRPACAFRVYRTLTSQRSYRPEITQCRTVTSRRRRSRRGSG